MDTTLRSSDLTKELAHLEKAEYILQACGTPPPEDEDPEEDEDPDEDEDLNDDEDDDDDN